MTAEERLKQETKRTLQIVPNSPLHEAVISAMKKYAVEYHRAELKKLRVTDVSESVCELDALKDGYCENYRCKADCIGCDFYKQNVHITD